MNNLLLAISHSLLPADIVNTINMPSNTNSNNNNSSIDLPSSNSTQQGAGAVPNGGTSNKTFFSQGKGSDIGSGGSIPGYQYQYRHALRASIVNVANLDSYYNMYKEYAKEKGWTTCGMVYSTVALAYSREHRSEEVLNVLRDMTEAHFEPSIEFCNALLEVVLLEGDTKVRYNSR